MGAKIRLSQCMIVKNEEENIARALSWGKGIVYEQIVVDTGSIDRTMEIAEGMGAKVFRFEWTDDFSAAKNFALEKASGDWIAFLDADEYYNEGDAHKLWACIEELESRDTVERPHVIRSSLLQLDDEGKVFAVTVQDRIFRNLPGLRYRNRIHEELFLYDGNKLEIMDQSSDLSICHTGYSVSSYLKTNKLDRDIALLTRETQENPRNYNAWSYLGRELMQVGRLEEAKAACQRALEAQGDEMAPVLRTTACCTLMEILAGENSRESLAEMEGIYRGYQEQGEKCPDMEYWVGLRMYRQERKEEACCWLEKALDDLDCYKGSYTLRMPGELKNVYLLLLRLCIETDKRELAVRYAVLSLRLDRFCGAALEGLLSVLTKDDASVDNAVAVYRFLEKIYDYGTLRDKLFLIKLAKLTGFRNLESLLLALLTEDERRWLKKDGRSYYYLTREQCLEKYPSIHCRNETDRAFLSLMEKAGTRTVQELLEDLDIGRFRLEKESRSDRWLMDHDGGESLIASLKENRDRLIGFYEGLQDNRSRRILLAAVNDWMNLDDMLLLREAERGLPYFDTDLIPECIGKVFVDAEASEGESVLHFLEVYGGGWKRIYCYEAIPESAQRMESRLEKLEHVHIRPCAVGSGRATRGLGRIRNDREDSLALLEQEKVEVVSLDEDIPERIDFIKLNISGTECDALAGCKRHMEQEHPVLAVSLSGNPEAFWNTAELIAGVDTGYKIYLRCYEGPDSRLKIVLYAIYQFAPVVK